MAWSSFPIMTPSALPDFAACWLRFLTSLTLLAIVLAE
jgi:hypothetical protein